MIGHIIAPAMASDQTKLYPSGPVKALALRKVGGDEARLINQIAKRRPPLRFAWLDRTWTLELVPVDKPIHQLMDDLFIDWGNAQVHMRLEKSLLDAAVRQIAGSAVCDIPPQMRSVLVEAAFDTLLSQVEIATRKRVSLVFPNATGEQQYCVSAERDRNSHGLLLQLHDGERLYSAEVWLDILGLGFTATALRNWPIVPFSINHWRTFPLSVVLSAGWTRISLSSLRSLATHDVVLLDECFVSASCDRIFLTSGNRRVLVGRIEGTRLHIEEELEEVLGNFEEYEAEHDSVGERDFLESVEDLPVRLQFDLGERQVAFAELQSLGTGHIFDLGREIRRAVMIRANGRLIGEGELVEIEGRIGVAIQKINLPTA